MKKFLRIEKKACNFFKSVLKYFKLAIWPVGQAVKTPPFHGGIRGSIPLRVTKSQYMAIMYKHDSHFFRNAEPELTAVIASDIINFSVDEPRLLQTQI